MLFSFIIPVYEKFCICIFIFLYMHRKLSRSIPLNIWEKTIKKFYWYCTWNDDNKIKLAVIKIGLLIRWRDFFNNPWTILKILRFLKWRICNLFNLTHKTFSSTIFFLKSLKYIFQRKGTILLNEKASHGYYLSEESDHMFGWESTLAKSVYITRKEAHSRYLEPGQCEILIRKEEKKWK